MGGATACPLVAEITAQEVARRFPEPHAKALNTGYLELLYWDSQS